MALSESGDYGRCAVVACVLSVVSDATTVPTLQICAWQPSAPFIIPRLSASSVPGAKLLRRNPAPAADSRARRPARLARPTRPTDTMHLPNRTRLVGHAEPPLLHLEFLLARADLGLGELACLLLDRLVVEHCVGSATTLGSWQAAEVYSPTIYRSIRWKPLSALMASFASSGDSNTTYAVPFVLSSVLVPRRTCRIGPYLPNRSYRSDPEMLKFLLSAEFESC